MFILKKGHQPGVYVPLRALFLVLVVQHGLCRRWSEKAKTSFLATRFIFALIKFS